MLTHRLLSVIVAVALLAVPAVGEPPSPTPTAASDGLAPILGNWWASAPVPGGGVFLQCEIGGTVEKPVAVVTIPKLGVFVREAGDVEVDDAGMVFRVRAAGLTAEIAISLEQVGSGTIVFPEGPPQVVALPATAFTLKAIPDVRGADTASRHDGVLQIPGGGRLPISVVLAEIEGQGHGLVDIPAQGVQGLVLLPGSLGPEDAGDPFLTDPEARHWRLPVPVEARLTLVPLGESWRGRFRQGPLALDLDFERAADATVSSARRPQDPVPPLPYQEIEVEIPTPGGHVLAGTVVVPDAMPPEDGHPAVVMVSGSGPQNRDEELMGHRPFRVLADRLARAGIASLRFDDRGIAASTGEFAGATSFDFADDAAAALGHLQRFPGIDGHRCGLVGHSEGGAVIAIVAAGMAPTASDAEPAFLVSIAGCGVDGGTVLYDQLARIYRTSGVDEETIARISDLQARVIEAIRDEEMDRESVLPALRALQDAQLELNGGEIDEARRASLEAAGLAEMTSPWMKTFVRFDPAEAFGKVPVPVLAVNGTLDVQVWHDLNLPAIEDAVRAGGGRVEIVRFEGLNHMLQPAVTGAVEEYAVIDITMDEGAMQTMVDWIKTTPARRPTGEGKD